MKNIVGKSDARKMAIVERENAAYWLSQHNALAGMAPAKLAPIGHTLDAMLARASECVSRSVEHDRVASRGGALAKLASRCKRFFSPR